MSLIFKIGSNSFSSALQNAIDEEANKEETLTASTANSSANTSPEHGPKTAEQLREEKETRHRRRLLRRRKAKFIFYLKKFIAFFFTQIGLCILIICYVICGGFLFPWLERKAFEFKIDKATDEINMQKNAITRALHEQQQQTTQEAPPIPNKPGEARAYRIGKMAGLKFVMQHFEKKDIHGETPTSSPKEKLDSFYRWLKNTTAKENADFVRSSTQSSLEKAEPKNQILTNYDIEKNLTELVQLVSSKTIDGWKPQYINSRINDWTFVDGMLFSITVVTTIG
ncbi:hypothetical protein Ciccas_010274 [Cichlidogyrus casuarinus]|uniref:Uncharacterized protein n=1 Tax=Cichlidogyrus casuarinus TaxID=1844966 RepID=A0ABD2PUM8_9PLAT